MKNIRINKSVYRNFNVERDCFTSFAMTKPNVIARSIATKQSNLLTGFTIPEIMIGMVIMLFVMGAALAIYNMSQVSWTEGNAQIGIERDASIAMGKMIRGINGVYGIMAAKSVNTPNAAPPFPDTTVWFTGIDNVNRSFYLSNGELWYDPNTSTSGGESRIVRNVSGLEFRRGNGTTQYGSEDRVGIKLILQQMVKSKAMSVTLYTAVKVRN